MTVDWIRAGLKRTGKTRSGLAKALGRSPSAVTDLLNGHRRLRADEIAIVAEYLGIEPPRLIGGGRAAIPPKAPLVGYVGAGAIAHFYADGQGPFDDVDAPTTPSRRPSRCRSAAIRSARCSTTGWCSTTTSAIRPTTAWSDACASAASPTGGC